MADYQPTILEEEDDNEENEKEESEIPTSEIQTITGDTSENVDDEDEGTPEKIEDVSDADAIKAEDVSEDKDIEKIEEANIATSEKDDADEDVVGESEQQQESAVINDDDTEVSEKVTEERQEDTSGVTDAVDDTAELLTDLTEDRPPVDGPVSSVDVAELQAEDTEEQEQEVRTVSSESDVEELPHSSGDELEDIKTVETPADQPTTEELVWTREELIQKYTEARTVRDQLRTTNFQWQNRLADVFKRKRSEDIIMDQDRISVDHDQRYVNLLGTLEKLEKQKVAMVEAYQFEIWQNEAKCSLKASVVEGERNSLIEQKKVVGSQAICNRTGKPMPPKDLEQHLVNDSKKEADVIRVRLDYIRLKNELLKMENDLKSKEELAEGLHLIDFEQLKIENQTYNEKIEERNEELLKLRRKILSTVQMLTHVKEKLQFISQENAASSSELREIEYEVAQKRDLLSRTKRVRDTLRMDNHKWRENIGLMGNTLLLRDYENMVGDVEATKEKLNMLQEQHASNTLQCAQVRHKLRELHDPQ